MEPNEDTKTSAGLQMRVCTKYPPEFYANYPAEFRGLSRNEILQVISKRIKEDTKRWNELTVQYFEAYAADVGLYDHLGNVDELGIGENELRMLRLIHNKQFSAVSVPGVIKTSIREAQED